MKNLVIITSLIVMMMLGACSDNNQTESESEISSIEELLELFETVDYFVIAGQGCGFCSDECDDDHEHNVGVLIYNSDWSRLPDDLSLKMNGNPIDLKIETCDCCESGDARANFDFQPGISYSFTLVADGKSTSGSVTIAHEPLFLPLPNQFDPSKATTFNWTLGKSSRIQLSYAYYSVRKNSEYMEDREEKLISPDARSYTIPAPISSLENVEYAYMGLGLDNLNWFISNKVLFGSSTEARSWVEFSTDLCTGSESIKHPCRQDHRKSLFQKPR